MRTDADAIDAVANDDAVRLPLWRGVQPVAALWFDAARFDEAARAARMLGAWRSGAQALRFPDGDLLRFPQATLADCATLPGLALCALRNDSGRHDSGRQDAGAQGPLGSAPLAADELQRVRGFDLVLVRGARPCGLRLADGVPLDLSIRVEIGDFTLHDTFDCSATLAPPALPVLRGKGVREVLGDRIPPPSEEREQFLKQIVADARTRQRTPTASADGRRTGEDLFDRVLRWLGGSAHGMPGTGASGHGAAAGHGLQARRAPTPPSALRDALTRLAIATRASRLIGWRQGAYLRRMMKRFEDGDLGEALRHALPIDATGDSLGQAFGTPGRRGDLRLGTDTGPSVNVHLDDMVREHLREMYRRSFERLDREGRIDEAVFVLGELLNARQECLDYLERHGRHAQAAELALAWDMPAATTVRLLLLAGDWTRAVQIARRDGAFASAVSAMEQSHPEQARKLRLLWGESLADRGEWLAAMDAVWPLPEARALAIEWLRIAEDAGDTLSARALVRRAERLPDTLERHGDRIRALARPGDDPADAEAAAEVRSALAEALLTAPKRTPAIAAIANALLPAIAGDRAAGRNLLGKSRLNKLLSLGGDPYLKADLPAWSLSPASQRTSLWERRSSRAFATPAAGLIAIHDVAPLPERRYLVALGEAGVAVVDAHGRVQQRYATPAEKLVIADNGLVALAVARRETLSRVSRLDLVRRTVADLGSLRADAHASRFDGAAWSVVADNRILVIDTAKSLREVIWHVGDLPGPLVAARHDAQYEIYLMRTPLGFEHWTYHLSARRLASREIVKLDPERPCLLLPFGSVCQPMLESLTDTRLRVSFDTHSRRREVEIADDAGRSFGIVSAEQIGIGCHAARQGLVVAVSTPDRTHFAVCRMADGDTMATVDWPAGATPQFRESDGHLVFFDDAGRMLDIHADRETVTAFSLC